MKIEPIFRQMQGFRPGKDQMLQNNDIPTPSVGLARTPSTDASSQNYRGLLSMPNFPSPDFPFSTGGTVLSTKIKRLASMTKSPHDMVV